ncbi:hypothetical protein C1646_743150 [Rhizophagus diaphanus]|nr:hypothetical protein C1646_743150 [Rhizophagus diaphanus] [Rhizophagus sp. MUCL 43196]
MRGYSLEQDLRLLINNPRYSDIEILCGDETKLYGCRAILAARSEVFDKLLYNGMKESYEKQITFPTINSSGMEIILEYAYTGSIREESLIKDNIIEAFCAADYFQLPELQDFIMMILRNILKKNYAENYSPELLSKAVDSTPLSEENILLNLLVEAVATIPLNNIKFGRLSITALEYLLSCTHEKESSFATPEYEVFRYSAILAAKQVSNSVFKTLMKRLPTLEQIEQMENPIVQVNIIDHQTIQTIAKELEPLVKFIDFRRIKGQLLVDIIEPLKIVPSEIILNIYRNNTKFTNSNLNYIRGIPLPIDSDYIWDESACGSNLVIEDNGRVVRNDFNTCQSVRAKLALEDKGIFEWDVVIERVCEYAWVGVCASEDFDYEIFAGVQSTGWVIGSRGYCHNSGNWVKNYCPKFGDDARITVHLNMNKRTCAFTVNGVKYPEIAEWNNLPSKLHPVVSLRYPGRFRIEPAHNKNEKGFWKSLINRWR